MPISSQDAATLPSVKCGAKDANFRPIRLEWTPSIRQQKELKTRHIFSSLWAEMGMQREEGEMFFLNATLPFSWNLLHNFYTK